MPVPDEPAPIEPDEGRLADAVLERLTAAILDGTLQAGETLRDSDLQRWLGVSRTPIRDALTRLQTVGLIETSPSRYTRVTSVDSALARETLEYTGYQAGIAVRMAVPRLDDEQLAAAVALVDDMIDANTAGDAKRLYRAAREFVLYLTQLSQNRVLMRVMREAGATMERNLREARPLVGDAGSRHEWYLKLREAIALRDGDAAETAFRRQHGI